MKSFLFSFCFIGTLLLNLKILNNNNIYKYINKNLKFSLGKKKKKKKKFKNIHKYLK